MLSTFTGESNACCNAANGAVQCGRNSSTALSLWGTALVDDDDDDGDDEGEVIVVGEEEGADDDDDDDDDDDEGEGEGEVIVADADVADADAADDDDGEVIVVGEEEGADVVVFPVAVSLSVLLCFASLFSVSTVRSLFSLGGMFRL